MTTKTRDDKKEAARTSASSIGAPVPSPTWADLSGHWLRAPEDWRVDTETLARRQTALQRWRGLIPGTGVRL